LEKRLAKYINLPVCEENLTTDPVLLSKDVMVFACAEKEKYYLYLMSLNSKNKAALNLQVD
jgi:hypothetical protein